MKHLYLSRSLLVASLAVLGACGGDDNPPRVPACQGAQCGGSVPVPVPNHSPNQDYFLTQVIPMLQQQYGSVAVQYPIPIMDGLTIPAGNHTWAALYQSYILGSVSRSGCQISHQNGSNILSPWGTLNYGCYQNIMSPYMTHMSSNYVQFTNVRYQYYSFFEVFNWFIGAGSSYYQNYYYPNYGGGVNYYYPGSQYYNPVYCYDPYWGYGQSWGTVYGHGYGYGGSTGGYYGYGGYSAPFYGDNGRFFLNIGFSGSL